jgi:branched-chain amino acid transport system ATP-binding protein
VSLLEVDSVSVRFGGLQALRSVDLAAEAGTVTGLIGPNGAGKTTLFNVICGYQAATAGRVRLDGRNVSDLAPHRRARLGIARTFQRLETFGSLSARDNIKVAAEVRRAWSRQKIDTGLARLVELGRALATQPRLLLLDEPSSGLDETESEDFGRLLIRLSENGIGVLLVEHDIDLVMAVCTRIYVLDFGSILAAGPAAEIQRNEAVRAAYLGVGDDAEKVIEEQVTAG